ncbi:MAG: homoserine O-acetyltransferase [Candidatus Omnitrophica bacterium]|nr:homoserine O-acetyltransferase [Candidatus Omnitrophota bacterium]
MSAEQNFSDSQKFRIEAITLRSGVRFGPVEVAYETYGTLNPDKSNAILICHAFTGDAHAAARHAGDGPGWWEGMIGPGKAFDTDKYFLICSNVLGSCKGTSGPMSVNPATGQPLGLSFPVVTIQDIIAVEKLLLEHLGIRRLLSVAGGSMGGMQAVAWPVYFPELTHSSIVIAASYRHTAQQIAFHEVGRQAVMSDPDWQGGDYYGKAVPKRGLAVARMIGHITYMSEASMESKFGRKLVGKEELGYTFAKDFEVEGYLEYRGQSFVDRFDANSYLYLTKAMDYFDLTEGKKKLSEVFRDVKSDFLVISFTSDWLYPSSQSQDMVRALKANDIDVSYVELKSDYGHDAFLVEFEDQSRVIRNYLTRVEKERVLKTQA